MYKKDNVFPWKLESTKFQFQRRNTLSEIKCHFRVAQSDGQKFHIYEIQYGELRFRFNFQWKVKTISWSAASIVRTFQITKSSPGNSV